MRAKGFWRTTCMSKSLKGFCPECGDYVDFTSKEIVRTFDSKGISVDVLQKECFCCVCGAPVFNEEIDRENELAIFDAYKEKVGLLTSKQIKDIRGKFGLSAYSFALVLGMGGKTITRYENGSIQSRMVDFFLKSISKDPEIFKVCLLESGSKVLKEKEYQKCLAKVDRLISEKTKRQPFAKPLVAKN